MEFIVLLLGYTITRICINFWIIPKIYTGQSYEQGRAFNKPNWIELLESLFWLLAALFQFYLIYIVGWNWEALLGLIFIFLFGIIWLSRSMEIYEFQNSEIRLLPDSIHYRKKNDPWVVLENIESIYFVRVQSSKLSLYNNATDFAMVVQCSEKEPMTINIEGMYLGCYQHAIQVWVKKFYPVVPPPSVKKETPAQSSTETASPKPSEQVSTEKKDPL